MKKNIFLMDLALLLYAITAFFYFNIGNGYYMLIISIAPICLYAFGAVLQMDKENYTWVIFLIFMWISSLLSDFSTEGYKFIIGFGIMFLFKLIFESVYGWHKKMSRIFFFFSLIHTVFILLCLVIPDQISALADKIYTGEVLDAYTEMFEQQAYSGISGSTGFAAFFASVIIGYGMCGILNEDKKIKKIFLILIGVIALFLTIKRSFFVSNAIAVMLVYMIHSRNNKKKVGNYVTLALVAIILYSVLTIIPEVQNVFNKFDALKESGDISNGRTYLWAKTIELWLESPIFGKGINALPKHGISSHNVYLQVLAETGVFGLISFVIAMIYSFVNSCTVYKEVCKDNLLTAKEKTLFLTCIYVQIIFFIYCFFGNPLYGITFMAISFLYIACIKSYFLKK